MSRRKILVTGGAGFIGSHVADALLARGDRVWIIDDLSSGFRRNLPAGAEFLEASIADEATSQLFDQVGGFDLVIHHAAQMDVRHSVMDPRNDARINIDGFLNVVQAGIRTGLRKFVFVSSGGVVYGEPEVRPTPETALKMPLSPYGVTKLAAEYYLYYYHKTFGLDYAALRYGNVYGPRQNPHGEAGVVAIFSSKIIANEPLVVFGDGLQTRDYVYVDDVVSANLAVIDADLPPAEDLDARAFNVGSGAGTSVLQLAQGLLDVAGSQVPIQHAEQRRGELRHSCLDTSRLQRLGWSAQWSLADGLARTFEFVQQSSAAPARLINR